MIDFKDEVWDTGKGQLCFMNFNETWHMLNDTLFPRFITPNFGHQTPRRYADVGYLTYEDAVQEGVRDLGILLLLNDRSRGYYYSVTGTHDEYFKQKHGCFDVRSYKEGDVSVDHVLDTRFLLPTLFQADPVGNYLWQLFINDPRCEELAPSLDDATRREKVEFFTGIFYPYVLYLIALGSEPLGIGVLAVVITDHVWEMCENLYCALLEVGTFYTTSPVRGYEPYLKLFHAALREEESSFDLYEEWRKFAVWNTEQLAIFPEVAHMQVPVEFRYGACYALMYNVNIYGNFDGHPLFVVDAEETGGFRDIRFETICDFCNARWVEEGYGSKEWDYGYIPQTWTPKLKTVSVKKFFTLLANAGMEYGITTCYLDALARKHHLPTYDALLKEFGVRDPQRRMTKKLFEQVMKVCDARLVNNQAMTDELLWEQFRPRSDHQYNGDLICPACGIGTIVAGENYPNA